MLCEHYRRSQHGSPKPHGVSLHVMRYYLHLHGLGLDEESDVFKELHYAFNNVSKNMLGNT